MNQSLIQAPLPVCELLLYKSFMCPPAIPLFKTLFQITIHPNFYFNIFFFLGNAVLSRKPFFFLGVFPSLGTAPLGATKSTCVLKSKRSCHALWAKNKLPEKKFPRTTAILPGHLSKFGILFEIRAPGKGCPCE